MLLKTSMTFSSVEHKGSYNHLIFSMVPQAFLIFFVQLDSLATYCQRKFTVKNNSNNVSGIA